MVSIGSKLPRWSPVIENTVTLIRYVYEYTGGVDDGKEPMRMLLSSFVALHFTNFRGHGVSDLMLSSEEANRTFVVDVMDKVTKQMVYLEMKEKSVSEDIAARICSSCRKVRGNKKGLKEPKRPTLAFG